MKARHYFLLKSVIEVEGRLLIDEEGLQVSPKQMQSLAFASLDETIREEVMRKINEANEFIKRMATPPSIDSACKR